MHRLNVATRDMTRPVSRNYHRTDSHAMGGIATFENRTGTTLSYSELAERTGLARASKTSQGSGFLTGLSAMDVGIGYFQRASGVY